MSKSFRLVFLAAVLWLIGTASSDSRNFSPDAGEIGWTQSKPEGLLQPISAVTNNTISVKLSNIPVGKIIQIGDATNGLKFVKVSDNQYLSISPQCSDPVLTATGAQKLLTYTGNYQSYTFYAGCEYQIELWGASGGGVGNAYATRGGYGGYTIGALNMNKQTTMYFYLGGNGITQTSGTTINGGWNGGGNAYRNTSYTYSSGSGGGGSDIRTISGTYNNTESLRSRIMVAGAGGGGVGTAEATFTTEFGGGGGGLIGIAGVKDHRWTSSITTAQGGTQISGGTKSAQGSGWDTTNTDGGFGYGGAINNAHGYQGGAGGSGWYGGGGGTNWYSSSGAGGSSYISGHTGCVAVTSTLSSSPKSGCTTGTTDNSCSISPYGYTFTNTVMIDGAGYQWTNVKGALKQMPNPTGGNYASGVGHSGNGYARITRLN